MGQVVIIPMLLTAQFVFFLNPFQIRIGIPLFTSLCFPTIPTRLHSGSFKTGLQPSLPGGSFFNPHFRYASLGFIGTPDNPQWRHVAAVDWTDVDNQSFVGEVRDQGRCGE